MRIFARLQEGWSYDEIGREEGGELFPEAVLRRDFGHAAA